MPSTVCGGVQRRSAGLELFAVVAILNPFAAGLDVFADDGGLAFVRRRYESAPPAHLHAQHGETRVGIVKCHSFDDAGQVLGHVWYCIVGGRPSHPSRISHGDPLSPEGFAAGCRERTRGQTPSTKG